MPSVATRMASWTGARTRMMLGLAATTCSTSSKTWSLWGPNRTLSSRQAAS